MAEPFIGEIKIFAGNFAPRSWAKCDGQLLSISQNDALFSLFGTIYGGDGRTTFGLPGLRGRIPIHQGSGPGLTSRPIGQRSGSEAAVLGANDVAPHTHVMQGNPGDGSSFTPASNVPAKSKAGLAAYVDNPDYINTTGNVTMDPGAITNSSGGQAHENMAPYQAVCYIVSLFGVYPSRN